MILTRFSVALAAAPLVTGMAVLPGFTQPASATTASSPTPSVVAAKAVAAAPLKAGQRVQAHRVLAALKVRPEVGRWTYDRDRFDHWTTKPGQCDARTKVLRSESTRRLAGGCSIRGGRWFNEYTGQYLKSASNVVVDHRVALAEAWRSGANTWSADRRRGFANDTGYQHSLVGVGASVKRAKSDRDPRRWLPPAGQCKYVARWIGVKYRWDLSVDTAEKQALAATLSTCGAGATWLVLPTKGTNEVKAKPKPKPAPKPPSSSGGSTGGSGSVGGSGGYNCPPGYPIKGNADSMIYHVPGGSFYSRTKPEECFASEGAAIRAGYRRSKV